MSQDLYLQRELNCHRRGWASKNRTEAGRQAGRQQTLPLSPLDLISPEEALTTSTAPPFLRRCACVHVLWRIIFCLKARFFLSAHKHRDTLFIVWRKCLHQLLWSVIQYSFFLRRVLREHPGICSVSLSNSNLKQQWNLVLISTSVTMCWSFSSQKVTQTLI